MKTKVCKNCKISKKINKFYKRSQSKDKLRSFCKECDNVLATKWAVENPEKRKETTKKYRDANPSKIKNLVLKDRYNITIDDYNLILKIQDNKCAVCYIDKNSLKRDLDVDHNHITNKVRGLLCGKCNKALGLLNDSVFILENLITYLKRSNDLTAEKILGERIYLK